MITHETYIAGVAALALGRVPAELAERAAGIKLVYGSGPNGMRGVTYYNAWQSGSAAVPMPFVELCAFSQSDWIQIAGTTIHELGHVLAGPGAGHGKLWRAACDALGLRCIRAAGTDYKLAMLAPGLREAVASLPRPTEGQPVPRLGGASGAPKPCTAGIGTRGGKSRGTGSGSRYRLYECGCLPPVKVRVARDDFAAHCDYCGDPFCRA